MQITQLDRTEAIGTPLHWWRETVDSVGTPDYAPVMMRRFGEAIEADAWSLVRLRDGTPQGIEMAMGRDGEGPWRRSGQQFVQLYGPFDPLRPMAAAAPGERWQVGLIEVDDIYHPAYRAQMYDAFQVRWRLSTRVRCRAGDFQINAYGLDGRAAFGAASIDAFQQVSTLLVASIDRHLREGTPGPQALPAALTPALARERLLQLGGGLSRREAEVLALAVCGHSVAASAARLALNVTSIATYRRRGFTKLGVGGTTELLQHLLHSAPAL